MQQKLIPSPPRSDLHVHTYCSPDSSSSPDDVCRAALRRGLHAVGISDHAEFWKPGDKDSPMCFQGRAYSRADEYFRLITEAKAKYRGKLTLLAGVETGYLSTRENDIRAFLEENPFEYVIGSVHDSPPIHWRDPGSAALLKSRPDLGRQALIFYYTEVRQAAESGLFDIIAHIDIYERYFSGQWPNVFTDEEVAPVARAAVEAVARNARMELNLSTLHTHKAFPWSALQLLRMYREAGGKPPTVGSDSHDPRYIGKGLEKAEWLAKEAGFETTADWREVVRRPV
ncbi:MAG: histidinol-phosphatase HisJ family protein [Bacillota bacterium]